MTAASHHTQSRRRKIMYTGIILLIFSAAIVHKREVLAEAAESNDLHETNLGQLDLGGSVVRFALAAFRGPLVVFLWNEAIELQKHDEWQQLELRIRALTKLQPHFKKPWEYQGWNLAYNVSVEFDRVQDKYFYITKGIRWIAEGEQNCRNRFLDEANPGLKREVGDPDLRWSVGFYIQDKMSLADEAKMYQCFLHLSCTPPPSWDPAVLRQNPQELARFKRDHPRFVRKIQDLRHVSEGADNQLDSEILAFLTTHRYLPSLYPAAGQREDEGSFLDHFPVWPLEKNRSSRPDNPEREEHQDGHEIARTWFQFAQAPLPPPAMDPESPDIPPRTKRLYRTPKMSILIFRNRPAQAKSLYARQLGLEGWFVESQRAWEEADRMWLEYGRQNFLEMDPAESARLEAESLLYRTRYPEEAVTLQRPRSYQMTPELERSYQAYQEYMYKEQLRNRAHYPYWKAYAETNKTAKAIECRQHFYNANTRFRSDWPLARQEYEKGIAILKDLMIRPRKLDSQRDMTCLLALAWHNPLHPGVLVPQGGLFERTTFCRQDQIQEEIIELQDQYLKVRTKMDAPQWLVTSFDLWEAAQMVAAQVAPNRLMAAPLGVLPPAYGLAPTSIDFIENTLEMRVAPLDPYFFPMKLRSYGARAEAASEAAKLPPDTLPENKPADGAPADPNAPPKPR